MQIVLLVSYIILALTGFAGNTCLLIALFKFKVLRTPFFVYVGNIACSEICIMLTSLFCATESYKDEWLFGVPFCKMNKFFQRSCNGVTILTLCLLSIERYMSVCFPLRMRRRFTECYWKCIIAVWSVSIVLCTPYLIVSNIKNNKCSSLTMAHGKAVNWLKSICLCFIPLFLMIIFHTRLYIFLHTSPKIASGNLPNTINIQELPSKSSVEGRSIQHGIVRKRNRNRQTMRTLLCNTIVCLSSLLPAGVCRFLYFSHNPISMETVRIANLVSLLYPVLSMMAYMVTSKLLRGKIMSLFKSKRI